MLELLRELLGLERRDPPRRPVERTRVVRGPRIAAKLAALRAAEKRHRARESGR